MTRLVIASSSVDDGSFSGVRYVARAGRRVAGNGAALDVEDGTTWLTVRVDLPFRRLGIGTALCDRLEGDALDRDRVRMMVRAVSLEAAGSRIPAPQGVGSVPLDNPEVRFLLGRGYSLEEIAVREGEDDVVASYETVWLKGYPLHASESTSSHASANPSEAPAV